jgi:tRNA pseudouridine55 synthase
MSNQRSQRDCIDGVLLIDKPVGLSSNDALMRARRLLNARKAGHGGTLDPMASGLLPVAFGEATKFVGDALGADKAYLAELTLGLVTDTADAEGEVIRSASPGIDEQAFRAVAGSFVGEIEQVPPMHSALKRDGRPLYEYARAGLSVERAPRRVTVHSLELLAFEAVPGLDAGEPGSLRARIRVACSKGTYIRTLAQDIGERLGCGAYLSALRRERVGALRVESAVSLEQLEAMTAEQRLSSLAPVDFLLAGLQKAELDDAYARRFLHGQRLRIAPAGTRVRDAARNERVRVYCRGELLGVATVEDGVLVPARLVGTAANNSTMIESSSGTGYPQ